MSSKNKLLLILTLSLIICQETNKTEQPKGKEEIKEQPKIETISLDNSTKNVVNETHHKQKSKRDFKSKIPFNMTIDEMDTMMLCTVVVQEAVKKIKTNIESLQKKFNYSSPNPIYEKIGTDIFEKCNKDIDIIDYDKYNNETDLRLTMDQQILMYKYQRVDELFRQKKADERDNIDKENQKLKIGQIDMDSIPSSLKFGVFLAILILLFGGVFYLLKKLEKRPKEKKKKEKKKKIQ